MVKFVDFVISIESTYNYGYYVTGYIQKGWFGKETKFYYTECDYYTSTTNLSEAKAFTSLNEAKFSLGIPHLQKNVWIGDDNG